MQNNENKHEKAGTRFYLMWILQNGPYPQPKVYGY